MRQLALPRVQPRQSDHSLTDLVRPVPLIAIQLRQPDLSLGHPLRTRSLLYPPIQLVFSGCAARDNPVQVYELPISFRLESRDSVGDIEELGVQICAMPRSLQVREVLVCHYKGRCQG